jgi:hypothetical protein
MADVSQRCGDPHDRWLLPFVRSSFFYIRRPRAFSRRAAEGEVPWPSRGSCRIAYQRPARSTKRMRDRNFVGRPAARTATPAAAVSALIGCISNRLLEHGAAIARASFFAIVSIRVDRPSVYPARSVFSTGNAASLSSLASRAPARLFSECASRSASSGLFSFR